MWKCIDAEGKNGKLLVVIEVMEKVQRIYLLVVLQLIY